MKLRIFAITALAFVALDIASLALAGRSFGVIATLLLVIIGFVLGQRSLRKSGANLADLARGKPHDAKQASEGTANGLAFGVAGVLFMLPGFFSDLLALGLLLPWTRTSFGKWLETQMMQLRPAHPHSTGSSLVIEGEATEMDSRQA
jgi:UPF0716 protein FxsA